MNESDLTHVERLLSAHLDRNKALSLVDIGSADKKQTLRKNLLNAFPNMSYTGVDIKEGEGVDIVVDADGIWNSLSDNQYDVLVTVHCLEHVRKPWVIVKSMDRILKQGGLIIIIAAYKRKKIDSPLDCWRILPDGMNVLMTKVCRFKPIECAIDEKDCYFFGTKL
jgi:2-polyprenyl-3-methyl-5-hydroxy-6-metoxy-1,4-benzoquinol methylase